MTILSRWPTSRSRSTRHPRQIGHRPARRVVASGRGGMPTSLRRCGNGGRAWPTPPARRSIGTVAGSRRSTASSSIADWRCCRCAPWPRCIVWCCGMPSPTICGARMFCAPPRRDAATVSAPECPRSAAATAPSVPRSSAGPPAQIPDSFTGSFAGMTRWAGPCAHVGAYARSRAARRPGRGSGPPSEPPAAPTGCPPSRA